MLATDECFIAVHGVLHRHSWLGVEYAAEDSYMLFNTYAELLGWSKTDTTYSDPSGIDNLSSPESGQVLWEMYEAGGDLTDERGQSVGNILWVQVGLSEDAKQVGLPITQLVTCTQKVLNRIGKVDLAGFQTILPIGRAPIRRPSWLEPILATSNPADVIVVEMEIDPGADGTWIHEAARIIDELNISCEREDVRFDNAKVSDSSPLLTEAKGMDRATWIGKSVGRISAQVAIREFSLDTCGYLTAHIARTCRLVGATNPALVTIGRVRRHTS